MVQSSTTQQIRSEIASTRQHISQTMEEIEYRFQELRNWKITVERYPLVSLVVSIGIGIFLSRAGVPLLRNARGNIKSAATATVSAFLIQKAQEKLLGKRIR